MTYQPLARQSVGDGSPDFSPERLVNYRADPFPQNGAGALRLVPTPGLDRLSYRVTTGGGGILILDDPNPGGEPTDTVTFPSTGEPITAIAAIPRNALGNTDRLFFSSDGKLYSAVFFTAAGQGGYVFLNRGSTVADASHIVALATDECIAAANGDLYRWDGSTLSTVTVGALNSVDMLDYIGGYGIAAENDGPKWAASDLNDMTTWNALSFGTAGWKEDVIRAIKAFNNEVWVFGQKTIEVWALSGGVQFPFSRISGSALGIGCVGPRGACVAGQAIFFIGADRCVYVAQTPSAAQKISTPAMEPVVGDRIFAWHHGGQHYVTIRGTAAPAFTFHIETGRWVEQSSDASGGRWLPECAAEWPQVGVTALGLSTGEIAFPSDDLTDAGTVPRREIVTPPLIDGDRYVTLSQMRLHVQEVRTADVTCTLEISRDGMDYDTARTLTLSNATGPRREVWSNGLGRARRFHARIRLTEADAPEFYGVTVVAR